MKKEFSAKEQQIIDACQSNHWLSDWEEYPAYDYDYGFREVKSVEELREVFLEGNWAIRSGVIFGDLAFVQQVNGGDEWLTMKQEEGRYKVFESVSFQVVLSNRGEQGFSEYLNKLQTETVDQYWGREPVQEASEGQNPVEEVDPLTKYCECLEACQKIYDCDYYSNYNLSEDDFTVVEVENPDALQKFFQNTTGSLGSMALYGDLLFIKEEAVEDKWLALSKADGEYQSAHSYAMEELAQDSQKFQAVLEEIDDITQVFSLEYAGESDSTQEQQEEGSTISVLKVEVGKAPYVKEIGNDLKSLQAEVGGLIQVVLLEDSMEGPQMVVNEEGKLLGLEMNRRIPQDIVCGNFFICESNEEGDFTSLSPEKVDQYTEMFQEIPEFSQHEPDAEPKIIVMGFDY